MNRVDHLLEPAPLQAVAVREEAGRTQVVRARRRGDGPGRRCVSHHEAVESQQADYLTAELRPLLRVLQVASAAHAHFSPSSLSPPPIKIAQSLGGSASKFLFNLVPVACALARPEFRRDWPRTSATRAWPVKGHGPLRSTSRNGHSRTEPWGGRTANPRSPTHEHRWSFSGTTSRAAHRQKLVSEYS
jgi:hypothetical protein